MLEPISRNRLERAHRVRNYPKLPADGQRAEVALVESGPMDGGADRRKPLLKKTGFRGERAGGEAVQVNDVRHAASFFHAGSRAIHGLQRRLRKWKTSRVGFLQKQSPRDAARACRSPIGLADRGAAHRHGRYRIRRRAGSGAVGRSGRRHAVDVHSVLGIRFLGIATQTEVGTLWGRRRREGDAVAEAARWSAAVVLLAAGIGAGLIAVGWPSIPGCVRAMGAEGRVAALRSNTPESGFSAPRRC